MTKSAQPSNSGRKNNSNARSDNAPQNAAPVFKAPLKARPKLFYAMLGIFGVWVVVLLTMYFTTVYPHRHDHDRTSESTTR
jgi:hypothetical protein